MSRGTVDPPAVVAWMEAADAVFVGLNREAQQAHETMLTKGSNKTRFLLQEGDNAAATALPLIQFHRLLGQLQDEAYHHRAEMKPLPVYRLVVVLGDGSATV